MPNCRWLTYEKMWFLIAILSINSYVRWVGSHLDTGGDLQSSSILPIAPRWGHQVDFKRSVVPGVRTYPTGNCKMRLCYFTWRYIGRNWVRFTIIHWFTMIFPIQMAMNSEHPSLSDVVTCRIMMAMAKAMVAVAAWDSSSCVAAFSMFW